MPKNSIKQLWFVLREVWHLLLKADKKSLFLLVFLNSLLGIAVLPTVYLDKMFLDALINSSIYGQSKNVIPIIILIVSTRLILNLVKSFSRRWAGYFDDKLGKKLLFLLTSKIGLKYSSIAIEYIEEPRIRDRISSVQREGASRSFNLVHLMADLPRSVTGIISSVLVFGLFRPWVAIFSLFISIPGLIQDAQMTKEDYRIGKQLRPFHRTYQMINYYLSVSKTYLELRILGIAGKLIEKLESVSQHIDTVRLGFRKKRINSNNLLGIFEDAFSHSLDIYFAILAINKTISIGTAQAYLRAVAQFRSSLEELNGNLVSFYENYLYISDLVWFLNLDLPKNLNSGKVFSKKIKSGIEFRNVSFKYSGSDNFTLSNVSFIVKAKENLSIVGENGAGKSTLVKLLCGFYEPTTGEILIDGIKVSNYNLKKLWKNLSVMFQDFESYDFNSRETIGFGNIDRLNDDNSVHEYASLANIDEWVESLPKKYDTPLSRWMEGGVSPSGGQWQRLAVARALFKEAKIVVLDEPTSNVDAQAEEEIFEKLLKYGKEKILIFISHRFSTVRRADKIIVLDKGKILEQGSHEELMKQNGKYAHLFNLQAKSYQ